VSTVRRGAGHQPRRSTGDGSTRRASSNHAYRLFLRMGYPGHHDGGDRRPVRVAVQTVYYASVTKAQLLQAVIEAAAAG